jgi:hypothetical protein
LRADEDYSNLKSFEYFIDMKCEELERVLRENPDYAEYQVRRQHWGNDWTLDPYIIRDEDGANLLVLEPEIIDALNESEFRSYIDVEMKQIECNESTFWFLIATIVLTPAAVVNSVMALIYLANLEIGKALATLVVALPLDILTLLLGSVYSRRRKRMILMKQQIDLVAAQENSIFLSALQKLAALPNSDVMENGNYRKRLQNIEEALGKM